MKIGFIGLGNMGAPMALNLLKAGHELVVFDVMQANVDQLIAQASGKAVAGSSPAHVAASQVEIVITMLPAAAHVKSVYLGTDGILSSDIKGRICIDSSTIDPLSAREVAAAVHQVGGEMLDAPVSGGTGGAQAGTLTFMVGGEQALFEKMKPLLQNMGKNIVYCGGAGNGQVAKVANNMLLGISMIGTAEAMSLGVSLGMDPKILAGIINTSSGRCWSSDTYNPYPGVLDTAPAARGYTGGFGADLMLKDLGLATEAAKLAKQPVPLGSLAEQIYRTFSVAGHGGLDFSAIIKLLNKSK
jgi:3-hydroxyisobutyrate dehydrogenase